RRGRAKIIGSPGLLPGGFQPTISLPAFVPPKRLIMARLFTTLWGLSLQFLFRAITCHATLAIFVTVPLAGLLAQSFAAELKSGTAKTSPSAKASQIHFQKFT